MYSQWLLLFLESTLVHAKINAQSATGVATEFGHFKFKINYSSPLPLAFSESPAPSFFSHLLLSSFLPPLHAFFAQPLQPRGYISAQRTL